MTDADSLRITDWAMEDRPREKLMAQGPAALSNAELLAILIGSGTPKMTAVELMKLVLHDCNDNLNTLGKKSIAELMQYKGVGEAKAVTILAACELGKRRQRERAEERTDLGAAQYIYDYMHPRMQDLDVEEAWVLLMNQNVGTGDKQVQDAVNKLDAMKAINTTVKFDMLADGDNFNDKISLVLSSDEACDIVVADINDNYIDHAKSGDYDEITDLIENK